MDADQAKRAAAAAAIGLVQPGMRLGLGTGSTAKWFVALVGERVNAGMDLVCVPTSEATRAQAAGLGIPLTTLDALPPRADGRVLDLTVDGADELDGALRLIKGGGGALLREKIVASASARLAIIADRSKRVDVLGAFPLPVEIVPFGRAVTVAAIGRAAAASGCAVPGDALRLRTGPDGAPFVTDGGHWIVDCALGAIPRPEALAAALAAIPGVVEHGLFLDLANVAFVAGPDGVATLGPVGANPG